MKIRNRKPIGLQVTNAWFIPAKGKDEGRV